MDDVTSIHGTIRFLKCMDELHTWAKMKIKAAKSRSLSVRKGVPHVRNTFVAGGEPFPWLAEKLLRSLGRQYSTDLSNRQMEKVTKQQLTKGLAKIERSHLAGKHKVWC